MTFEEWFCQNKLLGQKATADDIVWLADWLTPSDCKDAWDYQQRIIDETMYDLNHAEKACDRLQERIYELEKQLQKVEQAGFYWMNKAQEQE